MCDSFFFMAGLVVIGLVLKAAIQAFNERQLMERNPEAYRALKAAEEDRKERRERRAALGASVGIRLLEAFFGRR